MWALGITLYCFVFGKVGSAVVQVRRTSIMSGRSIGIYNLLLSIHADTAVLKSSVKLWFEIINTQIHISLAHPHRAFQS